MEPEGGLMDIGWKGGVLTLIWVAFLVIIMFSKGCSEPKGWEEYTIAKNEHYSDGHKTFDRVERVDFLIKFDSSAFYPRTSFDPQINKLYGLGEIDPHTNSVRVGYQANPLFEYMLDIYTYWYNANGRNWLYIKTIHIDDQLDCTVQRLDWGTRIRIDDYNFVVINDIPRPTKWHRKYPYFGGNAPAPHRMKFYIKEY